MPPAHSRVLVGEAALREIAARVAVGIGEAFGASVPLLVGVLKGAVPFLADVVRAASFPLEVDFLSISAFGRGRVRIEKDLDADIAERHVVVVEDIVDTGLTLSYLVRSLSARGPASLHVATLFDRPALRLVDVPVRWSGRDVDEGFVVGYGMDFAGRYRNLRDVRVVDDLAALAADPDLLGPEVYAKA